MPSSTKRQEFHALALRALRAGEYGEAIRVLKLCLAECGPHLGPLSDLALAAYLHEDIALFSLTVEQLAAEFRLAGHRVSLRSRVKTRVVLSKCHELEGRVAEAITELDEALGEIPAGDPLSLEARCQKLRLLASFGREKEVSVLYRQCASVSEENPQLWIECFHALLLAEARLFGFATTWARFLAISAEKELQAADLRLCLIDLLEIAVETSNEEGRAQILGYLREKEIADFDTYEAAVVALASGEPLRPERTLLWKKKIAAGNLLKLLALALSRDAGPATELRRQLLFLLQGLDHKSRSLLQAKWAALLEGEGAATAVLREEDRNLVLGERTLSFAKSPQAWALLRCLAADGLRDPEEILAKVSRVSSFENLETLRIGLLRLNKKVAAFLELPWVFRFAKAGVQVHPKAGFVAEG